MNHNKESYGTNHEVNSVTIFLDDDGAALVMPKQTFRLTQNAFKKLIRILKKKMFYVLTN